MSEEKNILGGAQRDLAKEASRGYVWNQSSMIVESILLFVQSIIIARLLGPQHQGYYATIVGLGLLINTFLNFGFEDVANKFVAVLSDSPKKASGLFLLIFKYRALIAFVIYSLVFIFSRQIAFVLGNEILSFWIRISAIMFFFGWVYSPLRFLFVGFLRMKELAIMRTANLAVITLLSYFVLKLGYGISGLVSMMALVHLLTIIVVFIYTKDLYKETERPENIRPMFMFGIFIWLNNVVGFLLGKQIDVVFLSIFKLSGEQIGYYHIGVSSADRISIFLVAGLLSLNLSALSIAFNRGSFEKLKVAWWILLKMSIGISLPALTFVFLIGSDIITFFFGKEYIPAIVLFKAFIIVHIILRTFGFDQHITALYAMGREKLVFLIRAIWGVICIITEVTLIPILGVWGAFIATGSSLVGVTITEMIVTGRILGGYFPLGFFLKIALSTIVSILPIYFIPLIGLKAILFKGIIFVIIFLSMLLFIKPFNKSDYGYLSKSFPRFDRCFKLFSRI
ncbi:MAG: oligosaccharide flippase family protein [bacterium]